jgi:hypothetical protein
MGLGSGVTIDPRKSKACTLSGRNRQLTFLGSNDPREVRSRPYNELEGVMTALGGIPGRLPGYDSGWAGDP